MPSACKRETDLQKIRSTIYSDASCDLRCRYDVRRGLAWPRRASPGLALRFVCAFVWLSTRVLSILTPSAMPSPPASVTLPKPQTIQPTRPALRPPNACLPCPCRGHTRALRGNEYRLSPLELGVLAGSAKGWPERAGYGVLVSASIDGLGHHAEAPGLSPPSLAQARADWQRAVSFSVCVCTRVRLHVHVSATGGYLRCLFVRACARVNIATGQSKCSEDKKRCRQKRNARSYRGEIRLDTV